jgi:hypothetical protein
MPKRMPPEVLEYLQSLGKKYGSQGGKTAAKNMTAEERLARARKASVAARPEAHGCTSGPRACEEICQGLVANRVVVKTREYVS